MSRRVLLGMGAVIVALVMVGLFLTESKDRTPDTSTSCPGTATTLEVDPWAGVLRLEELGRTDDAVKIAVRVLAKTGSLPSDEVECAAVENLLTATEPGVLTRLSSSINDWATSWWWAFAIVLVLAVAVLGWLVRLPWWRATVPWPKVVLSVADADDKATGYEVGGRLSAMVRSQLLQLEPEYARPQAYFASAADAAVPGLPLDELPDRVKWFIALWSWLDQRNRLSITLTLLPSRRSMVAVISSVVEPTGSATPAAEGESRRELIERRASAETVTFDDYLRLALPSAAWSLFQMQELSNDVNDLSILLGTSSWEAYSHFLEGAAALELSDVPAARAHFAEAKLKDPSDGFLECRLDSAYADARTDDAVLWSQALDEFRSLAMVTRP